MDLQRKHLWLFVICGMIFSSFIVVVIFIFINRCILRSGKHRILAAKRRSNFSSQSNTYQEEKANYDEFPPQFIRGEFQSYENLAESPAHKTKTTHIDVEETSHDYEDLSGEYEEPNNTDGQGMELYVETDYVKVDEEESVDKSSEDYDDIDGEDMKLQEKLGEEDEEDDYDDIDGEDDKEEEEDDYDDVGAEDIEEEEEDYDDVGGEDVEEEDYDDVC